MNLVEAWRKAGDKQPVRSPSLRVTLAKGYKVDCMPEYFEVDDWEVVPVKHKVEGKVKWMKELWIVFPNCESETEWQWDQIVGKTGHFTFEWEE